MSYSPTSVESFGGLNLIDDAGTIGWNTAADCLNVDLDKRGRLRSRDGYDNFTTAAAASAYYFVIPYYKADGTKKLFGFQGNSVDVINTSGGVDSTITPPFSGIKAGVRYGDPTNERIYVVNGDSTTGLYRVTTAAVVGMAPTAADTGPLTIAVQPGDNRLVLGNTAGLAIHYSRVLFSDAGAPETFSTNNFVDLHPGDGEQIKGLCSWENLLFAFKESKFFVFYGNSNDSSGNPVFNYRAITSGIGLSALNATCSTPYGVYFLNRRGIYRTTGGAPELVSRQVDPIFRGNVPATFAGSALNQAQIALCRMTYHDERLYFAYPSGSSTYNDKMLVHDPQAGWWMVWDIPASSMAPFRIGDNEELVFSYATGLKHIGRHSSSYTDDDGTSITSRYRSGFSDLGTSDYKSIREWKLQGSGSPTFKTATDFGSLSTGNTVTLGTSPAVAEGRDRTAVRGRQIGWQVGATSAWTLNNLVAHTREKKSAGTDA